MPEQPSNAPQDDQVRTQPENEADVEQENVGRENMAGGGEWPDPDTPPTGPAPGDGSEQAVRDAAGTAAPSSFKDVLEADPVLGGSSSVGDTDADTVHDDAEAADH